MAAAKMGDLEMMATWERFQRRTARSVSHSAYAAQIRARSIEHRMYIIVVRKAAYFCRYSPNLKPPHFRGPHVSSGETK